MFKKGYSRHTLSSLMGYIYIYILPDPEGRGVNGVDT